MTLFEYLEQTTDWEVTVWDNDYDIETYFYKEDGDAWDKAKNDFAKLLTITSFGNDGVIVNMTEVIENKLPELKKSDLFIRCNIDAIMDDIENILAGYVSESWLEKFVEALSKED